jgi:ABC-type nitrate/sulfonate/bicarbonate transport system permease component
MIRALTGLLVPAGLLLLWQFAARHAWLRYGLTHAWLALVAVELLASSEGLGYLLVYGRQMFWLDTVVMAMAVIGVIGFCWIGCWN